MSSIARQSQHELQQRVERVSRRARWMMFCGGAALTGVIVIGAIILLGLTDYVLRVEDLGVRVICSLALWGSAAAAIYFFIRPAFSRRFDPHHIARLIEQRNPQLGDRLTSTLEFLHESEDDPTAGSSALRRSVVAETTAIAEDLNFADVLRSGLKWWVFGALLTIAVLISAAFAVDGFAASTALQRLLAPWQARPWPRRTNLVVSEAPSVVAKGASWMVSVVDQNGRLPSDAEIEFAYLGDKDARRESRPMTLLQNSLEYRVSSVTRPFRFRVFGGDDHSMDWRLVEVVEPAETKSLSIEVTPPAYLPAVATAEQEGAVHALVGSTIRIQGVATKPARRVSATIRQGKTTTTINGELQGDRILIPASKEPPIPIQADGELKITLTDAQGVSSETTLAIAATPDLPPNVTLLEPRGAQFTTARAIVSVAANVKEDVALKSVMLVYRQADNEANVSLFPAADSASPDSPTEIQQSSSGHAIEWDLSELPDLAPGQTLNILIRAADFKPQVGESAQVRLTIVDDADMLDRLGQEQSLILNQLNQALAKQRLVRQLIGNLMIQFNDVGEFGDVELQQLQNSELNQRQISEQLVGSNKGALNQINALLVRIEQNRLDAPLMTQRLNELADGLRGLADGPLPNISQQLLIAVKGGRAELAAENDRRATVTTELKEATVASASDQDEVIRRLESLIGDLTQWEDYRQFGRELRRIEAEQQAITAAAAAQRPRLLTRDPSQWTAQEIADLRKLALRQGDLAIQFEKLIVRMNKTREQLLESQPRAAEAISSAIDASERHAVNGRLREASRLLGDRQLGAAGASQAKVEKGLTEILDALANRREHEHSRQGDKLNAAADDLDAIAKQQANLRDKMKQAAANPNKQERKRELMKLAEEQERLAEETKQLGRRLERLQADQASDSAKQASENMQKAGEAGKRGDGDAADKHAEQAERDLEDVAREIESRKEQAKQDLFDEQMARLQAAIEGLVGRQGSVLEEFTRLKSLADQQGNLSDAQQTSVGVLARRQRLIAEEAADLAERIAAAKAFALALNGARREMDRVAARLDRIDLSDATEQAAASALNRLQQIIDALEKAESPKKPDDGGGGGGGEPKPPQPEQDTIQRLSELKLLRTMQTEINQRTRDLDAAQAKNGGQLNGEQIEQRAELVAEQGQLAALILEMVESFADNPAGNPDALPNVQDNTDENRDEDIESAIKRLLETDDSKFGNPSLLP